MLNLQKEFYTIWSACDRTLQGQTNRHCSKDDLAELQNQVSELKIVIEEGENEQHR